MTGPGVHQVVRHVALATLTNIHVAGATVNIHPNTNDSDMQDWFVSRSCSWEPSCHARPTRPNDATC